MQFKRLVCCCCSDYKTIDRDKIIKLRQKAGSLNIELEFIADLCYEAVKNPAIFKSFADENTLLAICRYRVAKSLFASVAAKLPQIIAFNEKDFLNRLEELASKNDPAVDAIDLPTYEGKWKAWYPLIDPERCNNCGKCVDFCLFGVYTRKDKRVIVAEPAACKTNCPACARVCPQQAIIFPKHDQQPFDGSAVKDRQTAELPLAPDEELYDILAKRRRKAKKQLLKDKPDDS